MAQQPAENMLISRLRAQIGTTENLDNLDKVVEKYGMVEGQPFSFDGHEFQREIIRDTRSRIAVRKCSQVGLSELMVQKTMAMMVTLRHKRIIFTLPVRDMASKFSKDRIDGLIDQSDYYDGMVVKANNSASQKKIGNNMLYIGGTFGDTGAISVPAFVVISDEVDFSNQSVLGKLSSRLRHQPKDEMGYPGLRFQFSTPTVDEYGIDSLFTEGDQRYYMVKCSGCNEWHVPNYFEDMVVPGFDKSMEDLERRDFQNTDYKFSKSWIKCPGCGSNLWRDLIRPDRRQWVAKHPDRWIHSYQVFPWDVPQTNTPAAIMMQFTEYDSTQDFVNFVIGLPFTSADNSFITTDDHKERTNKAELWMFQNSIVKQSTVAGVDVGKICHLTVLVTTPKMDYVVWAEAIPNTLSTPAAEAILQRFEFYKVRKMVVDEGPDITLVNTLISAKPSGRISACRYAQSTPGLSIIREMEEGALIVADRSATLGETMKAHNSGKLQYAKTLVEPIFKHLKVIKKIKVKDANGDTTDRFVANGDDHFGHSLNYALVAKRAVEEFKDGSSGFSMPPLLSKFKMKR